MLLDERDDLGIPADVGTVSRRAGGPDAGVRIGAAVEQQTRHVDRVLHDSPEERSTSRPGLICDGPDLYAFIGIEPQIEQAAKEVEMPAADSRLQHLPAFEVLAGALLEIVPTAKRGGGER